MGAIVGAIVAHIGPYTIVAEARSFIEFLMEAGK